MGGAPVWFQLYPTRKWEVAEALVRRAERAGSPVIVVTVDGPAPVNWETLVRLRRTDTRQCDGCHGRTFRDYVARKPNFDGINLNGIPVLNAASLTWDSIKRIPVLVDSGFRRGTDIIKALAMGARAVCIGRPYLWGLGAFGQAGVERVLKILRKETRDAMQEVGAPSIKHLTRAMVQRA
jgi:isopentenyl diphosphate isomerase/L-lactate dehydrogenase-like FMN-dependent dehydrogenase